MTRLDRFIQRMRIRQARSYVPSGGRVIDIGAHEGELFAVLGDHLAWGFGVEPLIDRTRHGANFVIEPGLFPAIRPARGGWDAVTLLAVLEHIPPAEQAAMADACHELLRPGGRVIVTVPSRAVDTVLSILRVLRLVDGMSLEQHYGFDPRQTARLFAPPRFRLLRHARFQFGLNNLYVFENNCRTA